MSGLKGWKNKQARRAVEDNEFYRSAGSTLGQRFKNKLTGKSSWYKEKFKRKLKEIEEEEEITSKTARNNGIEKLPAGWKNEQSKDCHVYPLHLRLRNSEETMEPLTNWKIKFVERAGTKVEEMLPKSNPWQGQDCQREKCMLDATKQKTGKLLEQSCTRRSVIYETSCNTCYMREADEIDKKDLDEKEKAALKKKIKKFKYIGESARSVYERLWEHQHALEQLHPDSHMLKHIVDVHADEDIKDVEFHAKVVCYARSAFERQIRESLLIQEGREESIILETRNSRAKYKSMQYP